jgi:hypothetical protein
MRMSNFHAVDLDPFNRESITEFYARANTELEFPGFFRISLTANEEMIERSLAGFAAALERARRKAGSGSDCGDARHV